ncbi:MAG: methylmalonyl-CoA mutase [Oligoflexia bacterium]|nr:methylmalonyl-CoA mutase [Oligoflexia bacterium]
MCRRETPSIQERFLSPLKPTDLCFGPESGVAPEHYSEKLGAPGEFPYTRGIQKDMYRGRLWTMRQYAGFGTAAESNKRYRLLLDKGQTGLSVAFDLPTQMGYDSDDLMARGEVGKVGVAISSLQDMETLLDELPLETVSTSMTINATAGILLALYIAVARKRGISESALRGTVQNDILKEYIARGTYIYPPKPSMRLVTDIFKYCSENVPQWNTVSISGYHIREAGSTAAQELAFTLANGVTYVESALKSGLQIDDFASRLSFFFNVHNNFFEEVAKFRAARRIWAHLMKERFGAKSQKSLLLRFHTQTAGVTLTAQQPENNVVRVTMQALSAVLGGTQSLHTNSKDEALGLPTEAAATLALRTQQIIASETGVADVVDPLGGSYYVEHLTNKIETEALAYLKRIDDLGGVIRCIETGYIQKEIQNSAYDYQLKVQSGEELIVGINIHKDSRDFKPDVLKIKPDLEKKQITRLKAFKKKRKPELVKSHLEKIRNGAKQEVCLIPLFITAVTDGVTLGEISHALRQEFGTYREKITI